MPNKQINIEKQKYIKETNSYLICDFRTRNKFISDLKGDIDEYIESNSINDFDSVYNHFGEPRDIAKGFLESADTKKIKRKMDITKVVMIAIIIALVMWGIFLTTSLIEVHLNEKGHYKESVYNADDYLENNFLGD